ncbi:MAG: thioredoxin [Gemmatimonadetes bacterium]|nr:thioredoxin [Gemmatimonadota bacterium]MBT8405188.1 thioredoxin [Gemmatimonadota bacterium]NNF38994.1 thioredoxin [Gemmatimonadota bacterium]NNK63315.1 thioredoxin [Gemmatimonadota bacterium]
MADSENLLTVTDGNFNEEVEQSGDLTMIDFWAAWCGPCRIIAPVVEQLADEYSGKGLRVGKLDVDQNPSTAARYGVRSIPTVLFFKDGEVVDRLVGAMPKPYFDQKIEALLGD